MTVWPSRLASRRAVSSSESGESETVAAFGLPSAPPRPPLEQLRTRSPDDEQRRVVHPVDEVVDEVEQVVVGPVQVLEDEHEGPALGERLEEAAPGRERLVAAVPARVALPREPDERAQVALDPARARRRPG